MTNASEDNKDESLGKSTSKGNLQSLVEKKLEKLIENLKYKIINLLNWLKKKLKLDNSSKLTYLIQKEKQQIRKEHPKGSVLQYLKLLTNQIYWPSKISFFLVVLILTPFFILSHYHLDIFSPYLGFLDNSHYQNLIAIYAGVSAIIFSLVIFIAQSSKDYEDKVRVLLKVSYLYPLLVASLLSFLNFIWGNINFWSTAFIIGIIASVIYSVSRLFSVLLNKYEFSIEYLNLLKDRFKKSVESAIDERVGNNILFETLKRNNMEYKFFSIRNKTNYHIFYSYKRGVIEDIDIEKIKEFQNLVENEAKRNGYVAQSQISGKPMTVKEYKNPFFQKKFKDEVNEGTELIYVNKDLLKDKNVISNLNKVAKDIFTIQDDDTFSKQLRLELKGIKDQFIDSIKKGSIGRVEEYCNIYYGLSDAFLEILTEYGGGYDFEQARMERENIFSKKDEFSWLSEDINEIFNIGLESSNQEIIKLIGFLPIHLARNSIDTGDHYVFQEFIGSVQRLYNASLKKPDKDLKAFMMDRSWRYLKETASLIEFKLGDKSTEHNELISLKDFAIYLLIVFQSLLEDAKRFNDLEGFKKFNSAANQLFTHFNPSQEYPTSTDLKWELIYQEHEEEEIKDLETQIERKIVLEEIESEINKRKKQMFFGLATWIFQQLRGEQDEK